MTLTELKALFRTKLKVVPGGPAVGTPGSNRTQGVLDSLDALAVEVKAGAVIVRLDIPGAQTLLTNNAPAPQVQEAVWYTIDGDWNAAGEDSRVQVFGVQGAQFSPVGIFENGRRQLSFVAVDVLAATAVPVQADLSAYARKQDIADLIGAAPAALDTLAEIAAQLQADEAGTAAILATQQQHTQQIATKQGALVKSTKVNLNNNAYQMPRTLLGQRVQFFPVGAATITLPAVTLLDVGAVLAVTRAGGPSGGGTLTFADANSDPFGLATVGHTVFAEVVSLDRGTPYNDTVASWVAIAEYGASGTIKTINGVAPDAAGEVTLASRDVYDVASEKRLAVADAIINQVAGGGQAMLRELDASFEGQVFKDNRIAGAPYRYCCDKEANASTGTTEYWWNRLRIQ